MHDSQLLRYSRHILLDEIGIEGQQKLLAARVLVVGLGGLGCPAALYLASAGIGYLTLADPDHIELSNLQRQTLYSADDLGKSKAHCAQQSLLRLNPDIHITALAQRLENTLLDQQVGAADLVLDCSDNFSTRYAVNTACVRYNKPLVSGAAVHYSGQISIFQNALLDENNRKNTPGPCYQCLYPDTTDPSEMQCATTGVFAPLTGIIGAMQAAAAIKFVTGHGQALVGRLQTLDGLTMRWHEAQIMADPNCKICACC